MDGDDSRGAQTTQTIQRLFVPRSVLQGTEVPVHVVWRQELSQPSVTVRLPEGFVLKRANNSVLPVKIEDRLATFTRFEAPGNLGLVLKSPLIKEKSQDFTISVSVESVGHAPSHEEQAVHVFKPNVSITGPNEPIKVRFGKENGTPSLSTGFKLSNSGEGIGLVLLGTTNKSGVKIEEPDSAIEFRASFWDDLGAHLERSGLYRGPDARLFREFVRLSKSPPSLESSNLTELARIYERVGSRLQRDPEVARKVGEAFSIAFANNLNILMDVGVLLEYLRSVESRKIVILNVYEVMRLDSGSQTLELTVSTFDLASHRLGRKRVTARVESDRAGKVPLHLLLFEPHRPSSGAPLPSRFKKSPEERIEFMARRRAARGTR